MSPPGPPARPPASRRRDIVVLDVHELIVITDYFVICSASSNRQVKTVIEAIEDSIRELGEKPIRREGEDEAGWWLLDYVDVVVHVFGDEERAYYDLERLWRDAPQARLAGAGRRLLRVDSDTRGPIAQLVERLAGSQEVRGSNPRGSTNDRSGGDAPPSDPHSTSNTSATPSTSTGATAGEGRAETIVSRQTSDRRGSGRRLTGPGKRHQPGSTARDLRRTRAPQLPDGRQTARSRRPTVARGHPYEDHRSLEGGDTRRTRTSKRCTGSEGHRPPRPAADWALRLRGRETGEQPRLAGLVTASRRTSSREPPGRSPRGVGEANCGGSSWRPRIRGDGRAVRLDSGVAATSRPRSSVTAYEEEAPVRRFASERPGNGGPASDRPARQAAAVASGTRPDTARRLGEWTARGDAEAS